MKKLLIFLCILMVSGFSGCVFDNADNDDEKVKDSYYYLKTGAQYTFSISETDLSGNVIRTYEETSAVNGKVIRKGKEYRVIGIENGGVILLRSDGDIIYSFIGFGDDESDSSGVEILYCRFDVEVGYSWESPISTFIDNQNNAEVTMTWNGTYIGAENVVVPAGSFDKSKKYDLKILAEIKLEVPVEVVHSRIIIWVAPDIGIVKTVETIYSEGKESGYKESRLTSYSIP